MTDKLPPQLLALFTARPTVKYLPFPDHPIEDRRTTKIDGISGFLFALKEEPVPYNATESWLQKKDREKLEKEQAQLELKTTRFEKEYKPHDDPKIKGSAYSTLFVSRLSYDTTVQQLTDHFRRFGPIERVRVVSKADPKNPGMGKSKGYAFVVFTSERDMKTAYKASEHLVLGGRRVVVDVERGRTVKDWRPRRFGGGVGPGRGAKVEKPEIKRFGGGYPSGPGGFRGGFRGGRGGFRGGRGGFDRGGFDRGPRNGYDAPAGAPMGPRSGGFGGDRRNANYEPVQPRGGGYRDRDGGSGGRRDYDDRRRY